MKWRFLRTNCYQKCELSGPERLLTVGEDSESKFLIARVVHCKETVHCCGRFLHSCEDWLHPSPLSPKLSTSKTMPRARSLIMHVLLCSTLRIDRQIIIAVVSASYGVEHGGSVALIVFKSRYGLFSKAD